MLRVAGFTVRTSQRELKLRAPNPAEYQLWIAALRGVVASVQEDLEDSARGAPDDDDDDDDDD